MYNENKKGSFSIEGGNSPMPTTSSSSKFARREDRPERSGNGGGRNKKGGRFARKISFGGERSIRNRSFNNRFQANTPKWTRYVQKAEPVKAIDIEVKHQFEDFNLNSALQKKIERKGFTKPTPIQDKAIPPLLEGKDLLGLAQTGTGKTGAFLIPLIDRCLNAKAKGEEFQAIIIAPTRELAFQIDEELFSLKTKFMEIDAISCVGGAPIRSQIARLRNHRHFIIGTPGRLVDLITNGYIDVSKTTAIVLDEVDCMLDMGFVDDMNFIIEKAPANSQKLFFSATMPKTMQKLVHSYLRDPVTVEITAQLSSKNVEQDVIKVGKGDVKIDKLIEILERDECQKVLIFTQMKVTADRLAKDLIKKGIHADSIHGDKRLNERRRSLDNFKTDRVKILVATDVAARGIDVKDISHVINYDQPDNYEVYVHRIGRTGRAGSGGYAYTFIDV